MKKDSESGASLKEAALSTGFVTAIDYDQWVKPEEMVGKTRR